ncbi:1-phosphatidylinositol-4,5-bisphosphate phosphodiesterase 1 [Scheffersomyces amazonensis]|uniref:1-phosphatidylinositol-4,5-bisphosphate phosphodiesterase 1 n=1 Tax=Scheffersomyces amazonensis TaxID=1078765 RepID=UPI00315CFD01
MSSDHQIGLTSIISPSDSSNQTSPSNESPPHATILQHRSNSSPVSSSLPTLFTNLRTNDSQGDSSSQTGRSLFRKFLHKNKSEDDITGGPISPPRSRTNSLIRRASGSKSPIPFLHLGNSGGNNLALSDGDEVELEPSIYRSMGNIKVPQVLLHEGLSLLKVSQKSKKRILLKIDPSNFIFSWKNASFPSATIASTITTSASNSFHKVVPSSIHTPKSKVYEFSLDNIKTVSYQKEATNYREELHISKEFENQWITIIYFNEIKKKLKTLHLIADSEHDLRKLINAIKNLKLLREYLAKELFIDANNIDEDKIEIIMGRHRNSSGDNEDGKIHHVREFISFNDILKYSKRLNINLSITYLKTVFNEVKKTRNADESVFEDGLNFNQFKLFVSYLKRRSDIQDIWHSICGQNQHRMSFDLFKNFVSTTQNESIDEDQLQKIFRKFGSESSDYWLPENFNNYLLSKYSQPVKSIFEEIPDYFNHPLNEYFISSSHNTYLMGRQVGGESSVEGYIKALQRGCRCVEIDVWDGENDDSEPIVNHGRTFTVAISFTNVIKAIKNFAFVSTTFPLIVSLEINCNANNQRKLVTILKDILGDTVILQRIDIGGILPSPARLKNKILLKVKKTSPFSDLIPVDGSFTTPTLSSTTTTTTTSLSEDNGSGTGFIIGRRKKKHAKIIEELSTLGVYIQGIKFRNFSLPESKTFNHCFSLSENTIKSMLKDESKRIAIDKHNRKYLMRVYPSGFRVSSSNFLPLRCWCKGVQMVATNWQTYDLGQQLNEAMFEGVQRKGYVLKPNSLRKPLIKSMRQSVISMISTTYKFSITMISAHQLPKLKDEDHAINPYVIIEIFGVSPLNDETKIMTYNTCTISENGFNPIWNETFQGNITTESEMVFIKLSVYSTSSLNNEGDKGTFIGGLVMRLTDLKQGYRYLPIRDKLGEELIYSSLFVKISYEQSS